jgi:uncharacterized membrane protein (DUF373 family)
MPADHEQQPALRWQTWVEKFEEVVVAALALLLVLIVAIILAVVAYLFVVKIEGAITSIDTIADVQVASLRAFPGILLVLLGLELLDTVKVYFREHAVRVEVVLLVGMIAMGRHVLDIDLHHIEPLTLFGFSGLILVLALSYFLVKRADLGVIRLKRHGHDGEGPTGT